jgi:hypothetical protein
MVKYKINENREIELNATIDELNNALSWDNEIKFRVWVDAINEFPNEIAIEIANDYVDEISS